MAEHKDSSKAVDVALAEFNALRAEIMARSTTQTSLASVGLTASGVAVGFALSDKGDVHYAAVVPFFAACIVMIYVYESVRIIHLGRYIRENLWPYIQNGVDRSLPSWEAHLASGNGPRVLAVGLGETLIVTIFLLLGITLTAWIPGLSLTLRLMSYAALAAAIAASLLMLILVRQATSIDSTAE